MASDTGAGYVFALIIKLSCACRAGIVLDGLRVEYRKDLRYCPFFGKTIPLEAIVNVVLQNQCDLVFQVPLGYGRSRRSAVWGKLCLVFRTAGWAFAPLPSPELSPKCHPYSFELD